MSEDRYLEFEIEVVGSIEEVWQAISTGPGITSWYVPHVIEEREGGAATASFGPGPECRSWEGSPLGSRPTEWYSTVAKGPTGWRSSGWSKPGTVAPVL